MTMKKSSELRTIFGRLREAYYCKSCPDLSATTPADILLSADYEMPLSEDGVTLEPVGSSPSITRKKISNGANWYSFAEKGDSNITMQVPSFDASLDELFLEKTTASAISTKVDKDSFTGNGYNLDPKKFGGAWIFTTAEKDFVVILPETENFATPVGATTKEMGYFNVAVTPLRHAKYGDIVILQKKTTA